MTPNERRLTLMWVAFFVWKALDGVQGCGCMNNAQENRHAAV